VNLTHDLQQKNTEITHNFALRGLITAKFRFMKPVFGISLMNLALKRLFHVKPPPPFTETNCV